MHVAASYYGKLAALHNMCQPVCKNVITTGSSRKCVYQLVMHVVRGALQLS